MFTYTTPTITCTLTGVEFSQVDYVRIAVKGKASEIVRVVPISDIDTETGTAYITLTQEETVMAARRPSVRGRSLYKHAYTTRMARYKLQTRCSAIWTACLIRW